MPCAWVHRQLLTTLADEYRQPMATVQQDSLCFARSLLERGCVEPVTQIPGPLSGSRVARGQLPVRRATVKLVLGETWNW
jgi:hypothetical protein